ncbi:hypothetical protein [uncultured Treponema sp.]|uniref:hypothetical protein n=1 Tax=uncultured Treponema sp. TaxID=162155 RepID=UPI0025EEA659|nr:hypothetical protein [uncultured Treponema sp.]
MSFYSFAFAFFLFISLFVYYIVPKRFQWFVLLLANTVFYALSGIGNFIFILASSLVTFFGKPCKFLAEMAYHSRWLDA